MIGKKHKNKHKNKEKCEDKPKEGKERGRDVEKHKEKKEKRRYGHLKKKSTKHSFIHCSIVKGPILYFLEFYLGFDVLKNIYSAVH